MGCTFQGTARHIELRGEGTTSLLRAAAFEEGLATRVELETGNVGAAYAPVTIKEPIELDPVDLDLTEPGYHANYELDDALHIRIEAGAARSGRFRGKLDRAPGCASPEGCEVHWPSSKRIALSVQPDTGRVAAEAGKGTPIRLTGWFPFVVRERGETGSDRLDLVRLDGVAGVLDCGGTRTEVKGSLVWSPGADQSLRIGGPGGAAGGEGISMTPEGLRLTVVSSFKPAEAGSSLAPGLAVAATIVLVVLVVVVVIALRRRAGPKALVPSAPPTEAAAPPGAKKPEAAPIVLLAAPADSAFSSALARHLRPHGRAVFDPNALGSVAAGADMRAVVTGAIEEARLVAVLVSAQLLSGEEPWPALLDVTMKRHREKGLIVVPVLARHFAWEKTELEGLNPSPKEGVIGSADNDEALVEVASSLAAALA